MDVKPAATPTAPPSPPLPEPQIGATPAPAAPPPRPSLESWALPMPLMDISGLLHEKAAPHGPLPGSGDPFAGAVHELGAPQPSVYRVKRGDTLQSVADKLGLSADALQAANPGLKKLRAGQLLHVPAPPAPPPALPPEVQQHIADRLAAWPEGAPERAQLQTAFGTAAFAGLNPDEQRKLVDYASGRNPISTSGRDELARLSASPKTTADQLRNLLATEPGAPSVVAGLPAIAEPAREPYQINGPTQVDNTFASGAAPAARYDVEIAGQTIPVYLSQSVEPKDGVMHSLEEVVKGLSALPASSRALIKQVNMDGKRNPADAYWEQVYNQPGFRSYMTAGASGVVDIYPTVYQQTQHACDASLIHETGHILSGRTWGNWQSDPRWSGWDAATQKDGLAPSEYARSSRTEDFSEALTLYQLSKGTPYEAEYRSMFPERWSALEAVLAAPLPTQ
ncbi:MAG TPA: LysM domain-containing protein [Myxococcaceae bacterium]|nr:LysM domain-containing protein [Myxococcaceae bacterium]